MDPGVVLVVARNRGLGSKYADQSLPWGYISRYRRRPVTSTLDEVVRVMEQRFDGSYTSTTVKNRFGYLRCMVSSREESKDIGSELLPLLMSSLQPRQSARNDLLKHACATYDTGGFSFERAIKAKLFLDQVTKNIPDISKMNLLRW